MSNEVIGIEAVLGLEGFSANIKIYTDGIMKANSETEKAASGFGKSFDSMGGKVNHVAGLIGTALVGATVGAGLALGGFAVKGIAQAEAMEKQMSTIAAIMGKTKDQVKPLADEIVKLGLDPTLMVDAQQAADAIQQLAKNGLSMDQILQGAAKSTVLLANATGADFGQAANIATSAMKLFNIDAKDMDKAVSGIVSVTTNSKFTIQDYALAIANGGGAARAAHVPFADFNTVIASSASYFSSGGDAATSFKTFLTRLIPTTNAAQDTMKELGLVTTDYAKGADVLSKRLGTQVKPTFEGVHAAFMKLEKSMGVTKVKDINEDWAGLNITMSQNQFFDANGQMKSMGEVSGILQNALKGLTNEQKQQALQTLFGADAFRTAVALADQGTEAFNKMQSKMGETDAADQAATKMNNLAGVIEIAKGMIDSISLAIGQAFLPMITKMAQNISQFVSDHGQEMVGFFQNVAAVIDAFVSGTPTDFPWEDIFPPNIAAMAYVVAGTIEGVGKVLADMRAGVAEKDYPWDKVFPPQVAGAAKILGDAIQFISDHLAAFEGALVGIGAVLAAAGIYSAVLAIGAAIATISLPITAVIAAGALLGAAWASDWGGIQEIVIPAAKSIVDWLTQMSYVLQAFASGDVADINWENVAPAWLVPSLHEISGVLDKFFAAVGSFSSLLDAANYPWENVFPPTIAQLASGVSKSLLAVSNAIDAVQAAFAPLTDAISSNGAGALQELGKFATGNQTSFDNVKAIWDGLTQSATNVFNGIAPIVTAALTTFQTAMANWGPAAVDWITTAITTVPAKISEWYTALTNAISGYIGGWVSYLIDWSDPLVNWISTAITNAPSKITEWYTALTGAISGYLQGWVSYLTGWSDPLVNWITTAITNLPGKISEWYTGLTGLVSGHIGEWVSYLMDWSDPLISWISTAITNAPAKISEWYTSLTQNISGYHDGWISYLLDWSAPLVDWITTAITNLPANITAWYTALTTNVSGYIGSWVSYLIDWSDPLVAWISTAVTNIPGKVAEWYTALTDGVSGWLGDWIDYLLDWSDPLVDWITTAIGNLPGMISQWYTTLTGDVSGHIGEWTTYLMDWSDALVNWITTASSGITSPIAAWYVALTAEMEKNHTSWIDVFTSWSDTAINWIATAAGQLATKIGEWMQALLPALATHLPDFIANMLDWSAELVNWITNAVAGLIVAFGIFIGEVIKFITGDGLQQITSNIAKWAGAFIDWVDTDLMPKVAPAMGRLLTELTIGIGKITAAVGIAALAIGVAIYDAIVKTDWLQVGTDIMTLLDKGVRAVMSIIQATATATATALYNKFTDVDWQALGELIFTYLNNGFSAMKTTVITAIENIAADIKARFLAIDWARIGEDILIFLGDGIKEMAQATLAIVTTIITDVSNLWVNFDWGKLGADLMNLIATKVNDAARAVGGIITLMGTIITDTAAKITSFDWTGAGAAIIEGMKKGLDNAKEALFTKVQGIVDSIVSKIKNALDWHSPAGRLIPAGVAIIDGIIVGLNRRAPDLYKVVDGIFKGLKIPEGSSMPFSHLFDYITENNVLQSVNDLSGAFGDLLSLTNEWLNLHPELAAQGGNLLIDNIAQLGKVNQDLATRVKLLDLIKQTGANPSEILGGQTITAMSPLAIASAMNDAAKQIAQLTKERLIQEQLEAQRMYMLRGYAEQYGNQIQRISDLAEKPMNFFQKLQFSQAQAQFNDLSAQIQTAQDRYLKTGDVYARQTMTTLATQREDILSNIAQFQNRIWADQAKNDNLTSVFKQQMTMLDEAKALGMDTAQLFKSFFQNQDQLSSQALNKMGALEDMLATASVTALQKQVAEKALLSTLDTNWNVSGLAKSFVDAYSDQVMTPLLNNLKSVVLLENERTSAIQNYNNHLNVLKSIQTKSDQLGFLNDQIGLLKQVADAGLSIRDVFAGVLSGQSVLGSGANINDLLNISNQLMDQLVSKAQAQLTPAAVALASQQQQVAAQKAQLDLLNRQLDIIHQGQQAGVNWEGFFDGLTTGINASEADILTATSRLYYKLIKQAQEELGIASPSKPMIKMGKYLVQGLQVGIQNGFSNFGSLLSSVPQGYVSNRSLSLQMGGVNIYNGLDEVMLQSMVQRVMERVLN